MVDPLPPDFRRLLKEAHPDLREADIDRYQSLSTRLLMASREGRGRELAFVRSESARAVEAEIEALKRSRMPNFDRVLREWTAIRRAEESLPEEPRVTIRPKR
jgi:hypothetical protein